MKLQAWEKSVLSYRGRWAWPTPPPCPPCSRPRRCRSRHQLRSDDGSSGCGPHESHTWCKNRCLRIKCCQTQPHSAQHASADGADKGKQRMEQRQGEGEGEGGRYCVMKGDQSVSHTFLWAGRRRPSSSARWELGRHGPHTWTLRLGPPTPLGCLADGRSWGALRGRKQHAKLKITGVTTVVCFWLKGHSTNFTH